jgi:hypothetical protein
MHEDEWSGDGGSVVEVNARKEANAEIEALIDGTAGRRLLAAGEVESRLQGVGTAATAADAMQKDSKDESKDGRNQDALVLLDREKGVNHVNVGLGSPAAEKSVTQKIEHTPVRSLASAADKIEHTPVRSLASAAAERRKRLRKRSLDEETKLETFLVSLVAPVFTAAEDFLLDIAGSPYRSAGLTQPYSHLFEDEEDEGQNNQKSDSGGKKDTENSNKEDSDNSNKDDSDDSKKDNNSDSPTDSASSTSFFEDLFQTSASAEKAVNHNVFSFRFWGRIYVALWKIFAPLVDPDWDNEAHQMFKINRRKITYMEDAVEVTQAVTTPSPATESGKDSKGNDSDSNSDSNDRKSNDEEKSNDDKNSDDKKSEDNINTSDDKSADDGKSSGESSSSQSLLFSFEHYPGKFFAKMMVRLSSAIAGLIQWFSFIFFLFFTGVASLDDAFSGHVASNLYRNTLFYTLYRYVLGLRI